MCIRDRPWTLIRTTWTPWSMSARPVRFGPKKNHSAAPSGGPPRLRPELRSSPATSDRHLVRRGAVTVVPYHQWIPSDPPSAQAAIGHREASLRHRCDERLRSDQLVAPDHHGRVPTGAQADAHLHDPVKIVEPLEHLDQARAAHEPLNREQLLVSHRPASLSYPTPVRYKHRRPRIEFPLVPGEGSMKTGDEATRLPDAVDARSSGNQTWSAAEPRQPLLPHRAHLPGRRDGRDPRDRSNPSPRTERPGCCDRRGPHGRRRALPATGLPGRAT